MKGRVLRVAVVAALLAAWLFCPVPGPRPIGSLEAERASPASEVREQGLVCTRSSQEMTLRGVCRLRQGQVEVDLLDASGQRLAGPLVLSGSQDERWVFVTNEGFPAGRSYRLRCTEREAAGRYRVAISQEYGITLIQRIGLLWLFQLVVLIILGGLWLVGVGRDALRKPIRKLGLITLSVPLWLTYPVLHEAGHIAAMAVFGAEVSGIDLVGITGRPHVQGRALAPLSPLKIAVIGIAGPMLPTLVGYALFALWISRVGRRWRERRMWLDLLWSFWTAMLVLPLAVGTPLMIAAPDRDYSVFVSNIGLPLWLSNSMLVTAALISALVIIITAKHLVLRVRAARRAKRVLA